METFSYFLPLLHGSVWAVSIDLRDVYLHVSTDPVSRVLLVSQSGAARTAFERYRSAYGPLRGYSREWSW